VRIFNLPAFCHAYTILPAHSTALKRLGVQACNLRSLCRIQRSAGYTLFPTSARHHAAGLTALPFEIHHSATIILRALLLLPHDLVLQTDASILHLCLLAWHMLPSAPPTNHMRATRISRGDCVPLHAFHRAAYAC